MNKLTIIGNLCNDPEMRTTTSGVNVCSFRVAVNRRRTQGNQNSEADYFQVSAWRELGENCHKYLSKGKKVCVIGPVSVRAYSRNDGSAAASMEVNAQDVEFLSQKDAPVNNENNQPPVQAAAPAGFTQVEMEQDELPF